MDKRQTKFEALAMPHLDAAYSLARWLSRSPADAEDIVQEALLRAFRAFDAVREGAVRPWLMTIVRNCWRDHAAKARRCESADEAAVEQLTFDGPSPEAEAENASERRRLDRMLALLPDDYREVLLLREMEDMSYREISQAIDAPIGTVMSRLARARALLKDKWLAEGAR
jgi:RNA polymerase sigma-70 factor (ECF subfamily)